MNKRIFFVFFLMIFALVGVFAQNIIDKPVAIVKLHKTEVLSLSKFTNAVRSFEIQNKKKLTLEEQRIMLDAMVEEMLILQDAENMNLYLSDTKVLQKVLETFSAQSKRKITEQEVKAKLEQNKVNYNQFLDMYRRQMMIQNYISRVKGDTIRGIAKPTEADIKKFYDANLSMFLQPEITRFSQIFFNTMQADPAERKRLKDLADSYLRRINGGTSFETILAELPPSQANGDKGYVPKGSPQLLEIYGQNFDTKLFSMNKGQVAVITSAAGYHVVKVTDNQPKKTLGLDDSISPMQSLPVRSQISNVLNMQNQQNEYKKAYQDIVSDLTKRAEVKKFPENIQL